MFFKTQQQSQQKNFYRNLMSKLDRSLTQVVSVENYEIRFSRSDYMHIPMYLCRFSFLTTLDIYKDYFKGHQKVMQKDNTCIVWPEAEIALVHHSLCRSYCVFTLRVLWLKSFLIFIINELKNFAANNLLQVCGVSHVLVSVHHWLVTYWNLCIEWRDCRYNTSPIEYWGKGSTVGWYYEIGQRVW